MEATPSLIGAEVSSPLFSYLACSDIIDCCYAIDREQMPMGMSLSMRSCGSLLEFLNEELYPLHAGVRYSELHNSYRLSPRSLWDYETPRARGCSAPERSEGATKGLRVS